MYGAILGDIIGSPFEFDRGDKTKEFDLFSKGCRFTDDSVMTIAIGEALLAVGTEATGKEIEVAVAANMQDWGRRYPHAGYGGRFRCWLSERNPKPYGSYGNGSAMRVSAAGWLYNSIEKTREVARATANVTHNHPEGIKGAEATASAIYMARNGSSKEEIKEYIEKEFRYDLDRSLDKIRLGYHMDETCQKTVPEAIIAFLEARDFEDAIRNAVSLGGDTDTLGAITGSIAEAFYGIPAVLIAECRRRLDEGLMTDVLDEFDRAAAVLPYAKDLKDSELGRPTKEAAWAFSSRFALYHERWDKAVSSAEEVMTAGFHKLYDNGNPETTYNELFTLAANPVTNKNNREFIVTRLYSEEANQTHNFSRELQVPNEEARYAPTRSLMDAYLCNGLPITLPASRYRENTHEAIFNNRDPRMAQTILKPGAKWGGYPGKTTYEQPKFSNSATSCRTTTGWYFTKFVELSAISRYNKDQNAIPLMRYAEVLLNWIEAKEMRGDAITQPDIDKSINLLRDRVGADKMVLTKLNAYGLNLRDEIRRERRVELALEGERYFDLLRWKQGDLLAKDVTGMRKSTVPPSEYVYVEDIPTDDKGNLILMTGRTFSDMKNYLWPIPFTQTQRNPNLLPNNPGWE